MRVLRVFWQFLAVFLILGSLSAQAERVAWVMSDNVQGRLIGTGTDIALQLRLSDGWHTYWKAPGDSGLPPRFDWSESENIESFDLEWPMPKRFDEMGLQTFGYQDEVTFPGKVVFKDPKAPAHLRLSTSLMVCSDICIPQDLKLDVALSDDIDGGVQKLIEFARRKVPVIGDTPNLKIDTLVAGPNGVVLSAYSKKGFDRTDVFVVLNDVALTGTPDIMVDEKDANKALIKIPVTDDVGPFEGTFNVTIVQGSNAVEKTVKF